MGRENYFRITDLDGDALAVKEVGGFDEPMVAIIVTQDADVCAVDLTKPQVERLIVELKKFVEGSNN
jgi:hypothetical protein